MINNLELRYNKKEIVINELQEGIIMAYNLKVFISYAHEGSAISDIVLKFSNKLRSKGIDSSIDQYETSPPEGWPRWMENQISQSNYVLIFCTKMYHDKFYQHDGKSGKGVSWEVSIIYQLLYDSTGTNTKFIPIVLDTQEIQYVPTPLKSATFYNINDDVEFDKLYWRLLGINTIEKPSLGKLEPLPEKERNSMPSIPNDIYNILLSNEEIQLFYTGKAVGYYFTNRRILYEGREGGAVEWASGSGGLGGLFLKSLTGGFLGNPTYTPILYNQAQPVDFKPGYISTFGIRTFNGDYYQFKFQNKNDAIQAWQFITEKTI